MLRSPVCLEGPSRRFRALPVLRRFPLAGPTWMKGLSEVAPNERVGRPPRDSPGKTCALALPSREDLRPRNSVAKTFSPRDSHRKKTFAPGGSVQGRRSLLKGLVSQRENFLLNIGDLKTRPEDLRSRGRAL